MEKENNNQIVSFDKALATAKSAKEVLALPEVIRRTVQAYNTMSGRKDGESKYQLERDALLEIVYQKPELRAAPAWCYFKVINKVMHNNWSLRDGQVYLQPVKRGDDIVDIKADPSPALRRAMLEAMPTVKKAPQAQVVLKGDLFIYNKLDEIILKHETTDKSVTDLKLDNILYSYQRIKWTDGTVSDVVVPHDDLVKAKSKSKIKSQDSGLWNDFPGEAAKKTATNRAFRLYHKYPDNSVVFDDEEDVTETSHVDVTPEYTSETTQSQEHVDTDTGEVTEQQPEVKIEKTDKTVKDKKEKKQYDLLND
jgi:hypothetical protein